MPGLLRLALKPLLIALAAAGLLSLAYLAPQVGEASAPTGRIAFSGTDGHIYTIAPDGSDLRRISRDIVSRVVSLRPLPAAQEGKVQYSWPTWAPDGSRLAYSALLRRSGRLELAVYVADLEADSTFPVYNNPPEELFLIAYNPVIPHYLLWSSDGRYLSVLAGTREGVVMYLSDGTGEAPLRRVATGAPLYHSWSPEGTQAFIHHQQRHLLLDVADPEHPQVLSPVSLGYRAPAWSPDGERVAFTQRTNAGDVLVMARPDASDPKVLAGPIDGEVAFLWQPRGSLLALSGDRKGPGFYPGLLLLDTETGQRRTVTESSVVAFFWSPDGRKLAYVTEDLPRGMLVWRVYSVDRAETRTLARMVPTADQEGALLFFDQYAYSHSPWSPDSRYLVVSGFLEQDLAGGRGSRHPSVYVLDTAGIQDPRAIADGIFAVWSPR